MDAELPLRNALLWGRWLAAAGALLWLPGHLLVGRYLRDLDAASRVCVALGVGLALTAVAAPLAATFGIPLSPLPYLAGALILGWGAGRIPAHREAIAAWADGLVPLPRIGSWLLLLTAVLSGTLLIAGYGRFVAPPHVHDASNHAFLVLRAAETGRADAGSAFAGLYAQPALLYLPGWHAAAALAARLGGLAPYVSTWFLPLLLAALLPASYSLLWRAWDLPSASILVGAFLLTGNQLVPGGLFEWGGFGNVAGLYMLPILLLATRGLWRRPGVGTGVWCGALCAALARIHSGEAYAALFLAVLTWARLPQGQRDPRSGRVLTAVGLALVALAALIGIDAWRLGGSYSDMIGREAPQAVERLGYSLEKYWKAGGRSLGLEVLAVLGMLTALATRRWRTLGLVSLALGAVFIARTSLQDPVTKQLTVPFYGQAVRVLFLQSLLLPVLAALPLVIARDWLARTAVARRGEIAMAAVLLITLAPAWGGVLRSYRLDRGAVPFASAEYALAQELAVAVPPDALIANFWDDGSTWAMHVSGRRFLQPVSWRLHDVEGRDVRETVVALREHPWPPIVATLRTAGVKYVYVSDRCWPRDTAPPVGRAVFDADPRFELVLRGGEAALYRIRWEAPAP